MLQDIQRVHVQGGDLEFRDVDGATPVSYVVIHYKIEHTRTAYTHLMRNFFR